MPLELASLQLALCEALTRGFVEAGQLRQPEEGVAQSPPDERTSCLQGQSRLGEDEGRSQAGRRACAMPAGCLTLFIINKAGGLIYTRHFSQEHAPLAVNECLR